MTNAQAQQQQSPFQLNVNQAFSPGDEAVVNFNRYTYRHRGQENDPKDFGPLELKLLKVDNLDTFSKSIGNQGELGTIQEILDGYKLLKSWDIQPEKQNRYSQRAQINLGKLDAGLYILMGVQDGMYASVPVVVTKYGMTTRGIDKSTLAYVYDKQTGKSISDFKMDLISNTDLEKSISIENGVARVDVEVKENQHYGEMLLMASFDDGFAFSKSYLNLYRNQQNQNIKSYIFTDRSAYRPGQVLYYKGTLREKEDQGYSIFPAEDIVCTILDPEFKELQKRTLTVDAHGSFTDSIAIGEDWKLGEYSIIWRKASNTQPINVWQYRYGNQDVCKFKIEEYKKPEYEVKVSFEESQYLMNETIVAEVNAQYFFGAPVTEAEVRYTVMRKEHYVPWYRYMRCYWWYEDYYGGFGQREIIENGALELDENGIAKISIQTNGKKDRNYKYYVQAEVIDASRRSIVGSGEVVVAKAAFSLSARSDKHYYIVGDDIEFFVNAADFSDQAVETDFTAELIRRYRDEKSIDKKEGKTDPKTGQAKIVFDSPKKSGSYFLKVTAKDKDGRSTSAESYVYIYEKGRLNSSYWDRSRQKIEVLTDKKVYNAGETVKAMIIMQDVTDAFFVVHSDRIQHYEVCEMEGENGVTREIEFVLDPKSFGKMTINSSYVFENRMYEGQSQITIIPNDRYLDVSVEFEKSEYQPGQVSEATVRVLDHKGNPVRNAEVSLSTADESLFFLYPDKTESIERVFYKSVDFYANNTFSNWNYRWSSRLLRAKELMWMRANLDVPVNKKFFLSGDGYLRYLQYPSTGDKLKLSGFVIDFESGQPIEGAEIYIGGKIFKTDKLGYYELNGLSKGKTALKFKTKDGETSIPDFAMGSGLDAEINVAIQKDKTKEIDAEILRDQNIIIAAAPMEMEEDADGGVYAMDMAAPESSQMKMRSGARGPQGNKKKSANESKNGESQELVQATMRSDFRDAIYWNPLLRTDEKGEVKIKIQLPDNLTTWRTTARVITDDTQVGQTRAKIITTKDLLVRMELPRFMSVGDELLIATTVHNYLDTEKEVTLRLKAKGVELEGSEKQVTIPANGEMRVDWKANAKWITDATVSVEALTNEESDAMELTIPVQPYGLEIVKGESLAVQDTDNGILEFELPRGIDPASVSLKLNADNSISSALLASLEDLIGYPYGCVEQTMSRFLPTVIVSNTLDKLGTDYSSTIDKMEIQKMVDQGFKRLGELQHKDGGWGWWSHDGSHPFMTAYVLYGMQIANESGLKVKQAVFEKAKKKFRQQVEAQQHDDPTTFAYQMMVAMHLGYDELWEKVKMPNGNEGAYEQALWLQAANIVGDEKMQEHMLARLSDNAVREGGVAYWGDKKFYYRWQDDRVETTANVIKAISEADPDNELLFDAVQWIMRQRKGNSWHNTRQTAMTVYGLQEIIKREADSNSMVEIWVNGKKIEALDWALEKELSNGKSWKLQPEMFTASMGDEIDLSKYNVLREGKNKVEIKQTGKGITYLSGRMRYFRDGIPENKTEYGEPTFTVEREYYKLSLQETGKDGGKKYVKEKMKLNEWKSGDDILVKVKLSSKNEREYILVEDPIPAGCEFIRNTDAYVIDGENSYQGRSRRHGYWNYWYTHSEFRDDKFAMTVTRMGKGDFEYSYLLKAQIPGEYKVSPAVAQLMYYPEFRGYSDFTKVSITD